MSVSPPAGIKRALKGGKKKPLLVVSNSHAEVEGYNNGLLVSLLGALEAVYVPIEVQVTCFSIFY